MFSGRELEHIANLPIPKVTTDLKGYLERLMQKWIYNYLLKVFNWVHEMSKCEEAVLDEENVTAGGLHHETPKEKKQHHL